MYRIRNKNIYVNRGDKITIRLVNNSDNFVIGDFLTFYITKSGDATQVLLSKKFLIDKITDTVDISLTSEETRLGDPIKTGNVEYWYEIELNNNTTLVGYDEKGPKLFILYPESTNSEEGGEV